MTLSLSTHLLKSVSWKNRLMSMSRVVILWRSTKYVSLFFWLSIYYCNKHFRLFLVNQLVLCWFVGSLYLFVGLKLAGIWCFVAWSWLLFLVYVSYFYFVFIFLFSFGNMILSAYRCSFYVHWLVVTSEMWFYIFNKSQSYHLGLVGLVSYLKSFPDLIIIERNNTKQKDKPLILPFWQSVVLLQRVNPSTKQQLIVD